MSIKQSVVSSQIKDILRIGQGRAGQGRAGQGRIGQDGVEWVDC
jgi:hypothetical protein